MGKPTQVYQKNGADPSLLVIATARIHISHVPRALSDGLSDLQTTRRIRSVGSKSDGASDRPSDRHPSRQISHSNQ